MNLLYIAISTICFQGGFHNRLWEYRPNEFAKLVMDERCVQTARISTSSVAMDGETVYLVISSTNTFMKDDDWKPFSNPDAIKTNNLDEFRGRMQP